MTLIHSVETSPAAKNLLAGVPVQTLRIEHLLAQDIALAHEGLKRFVHEVPWDEREQWAIKVGRDPRFDEVDDVIFQKSETDLKTCLHYRPDSQEILHSKGIRLNAWQEEWFRICARIWRACYSSYLEMAQEMDRLQSGYGFAERVEKLFSEHCLRVLYYKAGTGKIARTHVDRCGVAFHINETGPGFYTRSGWEWVLQPSPVAPEVHCFPGRQMEAVTFGSVPAVWHEVRNLTDGNKEREAMVFFGKLHLEPALYY